LQSDAGSQIAIAQLPSGTFAALGSSHLERDPLPGPARDRELLVAMEDRGAVLGALADDLVEVERLVVRQRAKTWIVDHDEVRRCARTDAGTIGHLHGEDWQSATSALP
jgi:hypothetical protein